MADAVIRVRAETDDAVADFQRLHDRVTDTLDGIAEESVSMQSRVSSAFGKLGSVIVPLNQGLDLLTRGWHLLREGTEKYLRQSREGDVLWQQMERRFREIQGSLIEMLVGTDDVTEGYRRLSTIVDDVIGVMDGLIDLVRPLVNVLRGALTGALRTVRTVMNDVGLGARQVVSDLDDIRDSAEDARVEMERLGGIMSQVFATQLEQDLADAREGLSEVARMIGQEVAGAFGQAVAAIDPTALRDMDLGALAVAFEEAAIAGEDLGDVFEYQISTLAGNFGTAMVDVNAVLAMTAGGSMSLGEALEYASDRANALQERVEGELNPAINNLTTDTHHAAGAVEALKDALLQIQEQSAMEKIAIAEEAMRDRLAAFRDELAGFAADLEQKDTFGLVAKQIEKASASMAESQRQVTDWASVIGNAGNSIMGIWDGVEAASNGAIGSMLDGFANAAAAMAAIMAFMPGLQGAAIGLGVAAAAGKALAAILMRAGGKGGGADRGGAVTSGIAAPTQQAPAAQYSTTVVNNLSPIVTRDAARELGPIMDLAVTGGYTRAMR